MLDYRNILRVSSDPDKSIRTMELELRSSHHTIRKVQEAAQKAGISWPLSDTVTNEMLMELLFPEEYQKTALYVIPDYAYIHTELARKGTNLTILWEEYCSKCSAEGTVPYMYTQYCEKYRQWARVTKATMRIQHKPGDAMEGTGQDIRWISMIQSPARWAKHICLWLSCPAAASPMRKPATT